MTKQIYMSEHEEIEFSEKLAKLGTVVRLLWALLAVAFVIGGWAVKQEFAIAHNRQISKVNSETVESISDWKIRVDATRYSIQDRAADAKLESQDRLLNEKRLQRVEDTQKNILDVLEKIETKLDKM